MPGLNISDRIPWIPGYGTDIVVQSSDSAERIRFFVEGNEVPTIEIDVVNGAFLTDPNQSGVLADPYAAPPLGRPTLDTNVLIGLLVADQVSDISVDADITTFQLDVSALTAGDRFMLMFLQTAGGGHTVTWPANYLFAGGTAPAQPDVNKRTIVGFVYVDGFHICETSRAVNVG